jgi:hypothetical protein
LLLQYSKQYEKERIAIEEILKKQDQIKKQIEAEKEKQINEQSIWNDAQAQIEILKDEINDIKAEIASQEFADDRKILREKIRAKRNDIQFLKSHRPKKDREKLKQFKIALKELDHRKTYDPDTLYAEIEDRFREEFFKQSLSYTYRDSEIAFPFVYDYRQDKEVYRRDEHSISDYEEANKLHDQVTYWKNVFQKAIKLQYNTYNVRGLKRGKLDRFKLHKQFNPFKKTERIKKKTHAISILISANTFESSLQSELDFAYILAEAVKPLKVAVEVIVFRSNEIEVDIDASLQKKYSRLNHNV